MYVKDSIARLAARARRDSAQLARQTPRSGPPGQTRPPLRGDQTPPLGGDQTGGVWYPNSWLFHPCSGPIPAMIYG